MSTVTATKAISLDGYATGLNDDLSRLHAWMNEPAAAEVTSEFFEAGAVIMGRGTHTAGQEPWGDDNVFPMPVFVLSHEVRQPYVKAGTTFTFVNGIERALDLARAAADGRPINLMGVQVVRQYLAAGLVDELHIHLVPILLGEGVPLFEPGAAPIDLETRRVRQINGVTHLTYQVVRP